MKTVSIGGGQGFWGDSPDAAIHMMKHGDLNYMACDYLAELTLSIMARQKMQNPEAGFARDFLKLATQVAQDSREKGIGIITNAGGMNVEGCVNQLSQQLSQKGFSGYKLGYVLGDDLKDSLPNLIAQGLEFANSDTGESIRSIQDKIVNVNVYHGSNPILTCLEEGANTVITGRASDSALFLAPLKKEFGWKDDDYDLLARGIMVGHLLECGGQGAGGNYDYDWRGVPQMDELGFPIAKVTQESLHITKAPHCGGLITEQSCKEQMLYEVHDPSNYLTPDVNVDISQVSVTQEAENLVRVEGIRGKARPESLKLSVGYHAGYKTVSYLSFAWPNAYEKAQAAADILMKKMARKGMRAEQVHISYVGLNALHLQTANLNPRMLEDLNEVVLRIAIYSTEKKEVEKIIPEIAPLQLNGPPGASFFGGRAKAQEVIALWPTFIPASAVCFEPRILEVK